MITAPEETFISTHAYVPEHLPRYVVAVSRAEPHLLDDYLCYRGDDFIVFIGYPLTSAFTENAMMKTLDQAISRFKPAYVAVTAPAIPVPRAACLASESDHYYRLDLSRLTLSPKVRNMVRRAAGDLRVECTRGIDGDHVRLIAEFLDSHPVSEDVRSIFGQIPAYVASVATAQVFTARDARSALVAFDVVDFGARRCAFYQFNFVSRTRYVPGASDLLLHEVVKAAREHGKGLVNLGLGINRGVAHFKTKWGGAPFLTYEFRRYRVGLPLGLSDLFRKL